MIMQYCSTYSQNILSGLRKHRIGNASCIYKAILLYRVNTISRNYSKYRREAMDPEPLTTTDKSCTAKHYTTLGKIFNSLSQKSYLGDNKVSVIGLDDIGIATVFTLLTKNITNNICMIDLNEDVLKGEQMDLQFSSLFLNNPIITSSKVSQTLFHSDPAATRNSKVCVVTTGTYKGRDEHMPEYVARNTGIIRALIPPLVKYSPDTIFIVASDPVDILSYATWKLSGVPKHRVIGTGTLMDTARFRYLLSEKLGIAPASCLAYVIGQRGENSVPLWSTVTVGGVRLRDINPQIGTKTDSEGWSDIHERAIKSDEEVRQLKGSVSWAVGLAIAEICNAIFTNANTIIPVSTYVKGEHAIRDEVFLSLPCVIGQSGVTDVIRQTLTEEETCQFRKGGDNVASMIDCATKLLS